MNTAWNQFSVTQQTQFMRAAGLSQLPEPAALTGAQWSALAGVVGQERTEGFRQAASGSTPSSPQLPLPNNLAEIGDWSNTMALVAALQMEIGELQTKLSTEDIQGQKADIAEANRREMERINEMIEKLEKASTSGLIGKIFGWIGAALALIGAAIATVATGGAAAPALALAIMGVGMMVLQETGAMEKIVEFMADNPAMCMLVFGPIAGGVLFGLVEGGVIDKDQAKMAIQIVMMAAMLVASIAGTVASGGAAATDMVLKVIGVVGQIAGAAAQIGGGAAGIAQAAYAYEAADLSADSKEMAAWLAKLQAAMSEEMERLQEVIDQLNNGVVDASDLLADIAGSNSAVIRNMGA